MSRLVWIKRRLELDLGREELGRDGGEGGVDAGGESPAVAAPVIAGGHK